VTSTSLGTLRLGTRRSALALAQSQTVAESLRDIGYDVTLVEVVTAGDTSTRPIDQFGGTGVFVTALRQALLDGTVDVAVHSYKDLPTAAAPGLVIAAIPQRVDPRDALVARDGRSLAELPPGATVGTGAPRRSAQLRALGLSLEVVPIRGNVDSRLRRVADGDVDAVVVAAAGLRRLGRIEQATDLIDPGQLLPAPAQGALAVECRAADTALVAAAADALDDASSRASVLAERTLLADLEAGCTAPVGALADVAAGESGDEIYLRAVVVDPDGAHALRLSATAPLDDAEGVGHRLAANLLDAGAADLIGEHP
jgi:hydroxymethylbilane synthase